MRSAHSSLTLTRIAACTLVAVAALSGCGSKDNAQAGPGAAGAKMPPPQVGVITTRFQQVALETELPARVEAILFSDSVQDRRVHPGGHGPAVGLRFQG